MVFYISVAATQIIPLVVRTNGVSLPAAGWIFGFVTPVVFNMFVLQQVGGWLVVGWLVCW